MEPLSRSVLASRQWPERVWFTGSLPLWRYAPGMEVGAVPITAGQKDRGNSRSPGSVVTAALIGFAALLSLAMVMTGQASRQRDQAAAWELHTLNVLDATAQLRVAALESMRGERGYLLTGDRRFLKPYYDSLVEVRSGDAQLNRLVMDNPAQSERLATSERRLDELTGTMSHMIALADAGRHAEMLERIRAGDGSRALDRVLAELDRFEQVERDLLGHRRRLREQTMRVARRYEGLLGIAGAVLLAVGAWASLALRKSLTREEAIRREMEKCAATDELTGLANRRETLAALDRHMAATRRHGRPLSLAILDIDHFKRVNDTHGHPAGDEVIRRVAQLAVEVMREEDLVGRLGGEEFVVVLPDTEADAAMKATDRLRAILASTTVLLGQGQSLQITLSAGVAQMHPGDDRTKLVGRADEAFYRAKSAGRDQVLLAA